MKSMTTVTGSVNGNSAIKDALNQEFHITRTGNSLDISFFVFFLRNVPKSEVMGTYASRVLVGKFPSRTGSLSRTFHNTRRFRLSTWRWYIYSSAGFSPFLYVEVLA